jgi:tetratricopeptide (TPR) repeat protein
MSNLTPRPLPGWPPVELYSANDNDRTDASLPQLGTVDPAAFIQVGQQLIEEAARDPKKAVAAAEVFRTAISLFPSDPWLHNGLGCALIALAQVEPARDSPRLLAEAILEFQKACSRTEAGSAAYLRFQINLVTTQGQHAELTDDRQQIERSLEALHALPGLSEASPYWPHVQDNIGNAYMALGEPAKAIPAYKTAISGWEVAGNTTEEARSLNNLGTAYAALQRWEEAKSQYRSALAFLSADRAPIAWGRIKDNLGRRCLEELQAGASKRRINQLAQEAQKSFEEAQSIAKPGSSEWSASTFNLAFALTYKGAYLATDGADRATGIDTIRLAADLYKQAVPNLPTDFIGTFATNVPTILRLLRTLSEDEDTLRYIISYRNDIISRNKNSDFALFYTNTLEDINSVIKELADKLSINLNHQTDVSEQDHIIRDILSILRGTNTEEWPSILAAVQAHAETGASSQEALTVEAQNAAHATTHHRRGDRALPSLPSGVTWPTETYSGSPEVRRGGGGIVAYLERVWLPLLQAAPGIVDLRVLRLVDESSAMGVNNLKRTGKKLPAHLDFPTLAEQSARGLSPSSREKLLEAREAQARANRLRKSALT